MAGEAHACHAIIFSVLRRKFVYSNTCTLISLNRYKIITISNILKIESNVLKIENHNFQCK